MSEHDVAASADGTEIAYEARGSGDVVVLVEPPLRDRATSAFAGLAPLLAGDFTVVTYDRRGRGRSTDGPVYEPTREVEDLGAVLDAVGGSAFVYSHSSGALLSLLSAAAGLPIRRLALLEPPLHDPGHDFSEPDPLTRQVTQLVDEGLPEEAVLHFHRSIGVPAAFLDAMVGTPAWVHMVEMAHTLVYDCRISDATTPQLLAGVSVPTLVLDSLGSSDDLSGWAAQAAAQLPDAQHRSLPGEWHTVADDRLAPVVTAFFRAGE